MSEESTSDLWARLKAKLRRDLGMTGYRDWMRHAADVATLEAKREPASFPLREYRP